MLIIKTINSKSWSKCATDGIYIHISVLALALSNATFAAFQWLVTIITDTIKRFVLPFQWLSSSKGWIQRKTTFSLWLGKLSLLKHIKVDVIKLSFQKYLENTQVILIQSIVMNVALVKTWAVSLKVSKNPKVSKTKNPPVARTWTQSTGRT